jgi:hypothetical protein
LFQLTGAKMQTYTVYLRYNNVEDLNVFKATSAEQAIAKAQAFYNAHADFADTTVTVYSAVAN